MSRTSQCQGLIFLDFLVLSPSLALLFFLSLLQWRYLKTSDLVSRFKERAKIGLVRINLRIQFTGFLRFHYLISKIYLVIICFFKKQNKRPRHHSQSLQQVNHLFPFNSNPLWWILMSMILHVFGCVRIKWKNFADWLFFFFHNLVTFLLIIWQVPNKNDWKILKSKPLERMQQDPTTSLSLFLNICLIHDLACCSVYIASMSASIHYFQ